MAAASNRRSARVKTFTPSLKWLVNASLIAVLSVFAAFMLIITNRMLTSSKIQDLYTITYLELDKKVQNIALELKSLAKTATITYTLDSKGQNLLLSSGKGPKKLNLKALGIDSLLGENDFAILMLGRTLYLGMWSTLPGIKDDELSGVNRNFAKKFELSRLFLKDLKNIFRTDQADSHVFVGNTFGQMVFTSTPSINAKDLESRPIVQKFITNPLSQGQLEYTWVDGKNYLGFFARIPDSNLILFVENPSQEILADISSLKKNLFLLLCVLSMVAILFIQWPLIRTKKAIGNASRLINARLAGDQFAVFPSPSIAEVKELENYVNVFVETYLRNMKKRKSEVQHIKDSAREDFLEQQNKLDHREIANVQLLNSNQEHLIFNAIKISNNDSAPDHLFANARDQKIFLGLVDMHCRPHDPYFTAYIRGFFDDYFPQNTRAGQDVLKRLAHSIHANFSHQESISILIVDIDLNKRKAVFFSMGRTFVLTSHGDRNFVNVPTEIQAPLGWEHSEDAREYNLPLDGTINKIVLATKGLATYESSNQIKPIGRKKLARTLTQLYHDDSAVFMKNLHYPPSPTKSGVIANMSVVTIDVKK